MTGVICRLLALAGILAILFGNWTLLALVLAVPALTVAAGVALSRAGRRRPRRRA